MEDYTGLAAVAWELFSGEEPGRDHPFFARILEANPGPALDVGCGTGRLLLPLLGAGHEVEGVEPSADMRAILHRRAAERGLAPVVHDQAMQALDLPRAYRTIFVSCGSFQLVLDRAEARETLRRFHAHLEPGGILVLIVYPLWDVKNTTLGEWAFRAREPLPDSSELEKHARVDAVHLLDQTLRGGRRGAALRSRRAVVLPARADADAGAGRLRRGPHHRQLRRLGADRRRPRARVLRDPMSADLHRSCVR
jgi:SAM-dependent methyltransferase